MDQLHQVPRFERRWVRRGSHQQRSNQPGLAHHVGFIALVCVGVTPGMPGHLPVLALLVTVVTVVIPVAHKGDAAFIGDDLQAMAGKLQVAINLRTEQAAHIGTVGISPARIQGSADGRTSDPGILFHNKHVQARLGKKSGIGQAVMAGANHDSVVFLHDSCSPRFILYKVAVPAMLLFQGHIDRLFEPRNGFCDTVFIMCFREKPGLP